jgi:predicted protein tyrosine phosphatase
VRNSTWPTKALHGLSMMLHWETVGSGRLALFHRPKIKVLPLWAASGCDLVVTLLSDGEGAEALGAAIRALNMDWHWLAMRTGRPPGVRDTERIRATLPIISASLDEGRSILIHCAAGMHRTGMIAYALLRWRGCGAEDALETIGRLRAHTRNALRPEHLQWAERLFTS